MLGDLLGGEAEAHTTPFDWLICPPRSAAAMLDAWRFAPARMEDLIVRGQWYWPEFDCWFWHDRPDRDWDAFASRTAHLVESFARAADCSRQVFVLSNTQNNLTYVQERVGDGFDFTLDDAGVDALRAALERRFPRAELHIVTYADRRALDAPRHGGVVIELPPDQSRWRGADAAWGRALEMIIEARPPWEAHKGL